jgi:hypothetical protein
MTAPTVSLVPWDADRATLIAHLDARPEWERTTKRRTGNGYLFWDLTPEASAKIYGRQIWEGRVVLVTEDVAAAHPEGDATFRAEATRTINAVSLRIPPNVDDDIIERFVAAYNSAPPDSDTRLILSGQVEPE